MKKNILLFMLFIPLLGFSQTANYKSLIFNTKSTADYVTIFDSTSVDVQESGLGYFHSSKLVKVFTPNGAKKFSTIKLDYDPLTAYVDFKSVTIYRANGKIESIDISSVIDYTAPARAIYWGAKQKIIEVGRLEPNDAIEIKTFKKGFTYALLGDNESPDENYIPPMRGHFYDIIPFWSNSPVKLKYYAVTMPSSKTVQYKFYNGFGSVKIDTLENTIKYAFTVNNLQPSPYEKGIVAASDVSLKLLLSTSPDWEAKSRWFYGVNEDYKSFEPTKEVSAKVKELLWGSKTEIDSIAALTHWVADYMRYSGLSMGQGEGFTLHNAEMNFTDRCGVCKDKASLLISMLRAAGFESYPAMTMAGSRIDRIPADQFNHSVTAVKLRNGQFMMLDPTWVPFTRELWSSLEQQQNYLIGTEKGEDLMITPTSNPENHYFKIDNESELLADGTLKGSFTIDAEGQSDNSIRRIFRSPFKSENDKSLTKYLIQSIPNIQIDSFSYSTPYDYLKEPMHIEVKYTIENYATVIDTTIFFTPLFAKKIFNSIYTFTNLEYNIDKRKYEFKDRCSRLISVSEKVKLPANLELKNIPIKESMSGSGANFSAEYNLVNNTLEFEQEMVFKKRIYTPADWPSIKETISMFNKFANTKILVQCSK